MIFSINAKSNVLLSVIKETLNMSEKDVYQLIQEEHQKLIERLKIKNIDYYLLKKALIPNQEDKRHELCLVIDTQLIEDGYYGHYVFNHLLPCLDSESTYSILAGDYIDIMSENYESQFMLHEMLYSVLNTINKSSYINSKQYFLIYINSITEQQSKKIIVELEKFDWFFGFSYLDNDSPFKSYISLILGSICIKHKKNIIASHTCDYSDNENINMKSYPYEENGFNFVSINEESYEVFLNYKIESLINDKEDESFSFNALFPKFDSIEKLKFNISDDKFGYLCSDETGKIGILKSIGYDIDQKQDFEKDIYQKICKKHIFNLHLNEYGIYKFNVCIDFLTQNRNLRKTTIALKYFSDTGIIDLITLT